MTLTEPCLFDQADYRLVRYPKGRVLYMEGDQAEAIYRLESGCIRQLISSSSGDRQIVHFVLPGEYFGVVFDKYRLSAEAVSQAVVRRYGLNALLARIEASPSFSLMLIIEINDLLGQVVRHLDTVAHTSTFARTERFLELLSLRLVRNHGGLSQVPMSRRDIADHLGLAPATLSRALSELERAGKIRRMGHKLFLSTSFGRKPFPAEPLTA